ncbi:MAG: hypothetical protein LBU19_05050 [Treponema sp.]|nr:hypothetical protein [Treponema sp.]
MAEAYPRKLPAYLTETCGYEVREQWPGIYQLTDRELGGMQIVETKTLGEEDGGVWLRDLRGDLKREELRWIPEESKRMPAGTPPVPVQAVMAHGIIFLIKLHDKENHYV